MTRRAVVTGATSGIGQQVAVRLAATGTGVVLVGRDPGRLDAARRRVAAAVPDADLAVERADLSLLADVRALADRLAELPAPDAVVCNAAVICDGRERTAEGLPRMLVTNHLAPYLLLRRLVPAVAARPTRFVLVGADPVGLARVPVDLDDLGRHDGAGRGFGRLPSVRPFVTYARTKNMNTMTCYALADRLAGTGITVTAAHPGIVPGTGLGRDARGVLRLFGAALARDRSRPDAAAGADTPAWLATAPDVAGVTGRFFVERREVPTAPHTTDRTRCDRLWAESARLVGLAAEQTLAPG